MAVVMNPTKTTEAIVKALTEIVRNDAELTEDRLDACEILVEYLEPSADTAALARLMLDIIRNGAASAGCRIRAARKALWLMGVERRGVTL